MEEKMIEKWKRLKNKHQERLLLFRCGDFYEMYEQDAQQGSKILGITLIKRDGSDYKYLAGFPHHALDTYLPKLIRAGEKVAICDSLKNKNNNKHKRHAREND